MDRKTREEMNQLSKQVFGSSSKWQKIMDRGLAEPHEKDREVMIPRANGTFVKKVFTDKKSIVRYPSLEEVRKVMNEILESRKPAIVTKD